MGRRGRFIVFEGGEATGKTTQARRLAERIGAKLTREPGGTPTGEHLRRLVLDPAAPPVDVRSEVLALLAARAQHVAEVIEPALAAGTHVVCDRFSGSTLAYQGYGRGLDVEELRRLSSWSSDGLEPDRIVLLTVPSGLASGRLRQRGGVDRIERKAMDFFVSVDKGFAAEADRDPSRWKRVDGSGTVDEVAARVWKSVSDLVGADR